MPYCDFDMLSVVDVYDAAAAIGKDFEVIIDMYGADSVSSLMPKVISVLEELEDLAGKHETETKEITDLQRVVDRLESEKVARQGDRHRFESELEQFQDLWRDESQELLDMVNRLQEENRRLVDELNEARQGEAAAKTAAQLNRQPSKEQQELQVLSKLSTTVESQRDQIRILKRELTQKQADVDALQSQSDRLAKLNAELRRKHCVSKKQAQQLLENRADLQTQLQIKEQSIREMKDFVELSDSKPNSPGLMTTSLTEEQLIQKLNSEGKMVIDKKDPNRPRFTLTELREVLAERNELKTKLIEVEEELSVYRQAGDDEAPVQGPINREPDEKVNPDGVGDIGIKHFFQRRLSKSKTARPPPPTGQVPRHLLSMKFGPLTTGSWPG